MIQAMADGGVLMGLTRETAVKFAAQTVLVSGHSFLFQNLRERESERFKIQDLRDFTNFSHSKGCCRDGSTK